MRNQALSLLKESRIQFEKNKYVTKTKRKRKLR
jgi:hypothetical protein